MGTISFTPIDLETSADLCIQFRRDAMQCSFADGAERFDLESGENHEHYLAWLQEQIQEFPEGCVHMTEDGQIVGQIEMNLRGQQTLAYINLLYLIPDARGRGLGHQLHEYVVQLLDHLGVVKTQLSVSPDNQRAIAFYEKHGWQNMGPHPHHADVYLMELSAR